MPEGFRNATVRIFDINGRQLLNLDLNETNGQNNYSMPATILQHGVYIVQIEYGPNRMAKKIVY